MGLLSFGKNTMSNPQVSDEVLVRLDQFLTRLSARHLRISRLRMAIFLAGSGTSWLFFQNGWPGAWWLTLLFILVFMVLVRAHRQLENAVHRLKTWRLIRQDRMARLNLDWASIPEHPPLQVSPEHPFAQDLNLIGGRSVLQVLDTTTFPDAFQKLAEWLLSPEPQAQAAAGRQPLVALLRGMHRFRDRLRLASLSLSPTARKARFPEVRVDATLSKGLFMLAALALLNVVLAWVWPAALAPAIVVYWVLYVGVLRKLPDAFDAALEAHAWIERIHPPLAFLETTPIPHDPALEDLLAPIRHETSRPSRHLKTLSRIATGLSYTRNEFLFIFLNTLMPWNAFFAWRFQAEQTKLAPLVKDWMATWAETEALCALGTFAADHPAYVFPEWFSETSETPMFPLETQALGHPLIPNTAKVRNAFRFAQRDQLALVTGSNMSGKSTFLRTLGVNLALAQAGSVVDAARFATVPMRLFTCLNVQDSVNDGISYFYAEVRRLKALLEAAQTPHTQRLFFLIDEIFRGTNNRERLQGSQAYIRALAETDALGLVSTHDLELVRLATELPHLLNYHFREDIVAGKMHFDYQLREGPCPTTNALRIMELSGLPT